MENCPRFNKCFAPLCPLDPNINKRIWYPDEPICSRVDIRTDWIKKQMRIKKHIKNRDFPFTLEMLQIIERVFKGLKGFDPDKNERQKWVSRYITSREKSKKRWQEFKTKIKCHFEQNF